eukprot:NODE_312_length_11237_cov_0.283624.p3 type:complete len:465 gc:universal NODE_312_length_11237_cov_0.283624:11010-9616(-)
MSHMSFVQLKSLTKPSLVICAKQHSDLLNSYFKNNLPAHHVNQVFSMGDQKVVLFDNKLSRNLGVFREDQFEKQLSNIGENKEVLVVVPHKSWLIPTAISVARYFPTFSRKTSTKPSGNISLDIAVSSDGKFNLLSEMDDKKEISNFIQSTQLSAELVDTPPNELYTTAYAERIRSVFKDLPVEFTELKGEDLKNNGLGGLWNVGKGAAFPPVLLIVSYYGNDRSLPSTCLVGKGIVYDSGGLSIKSTSNMTSMKSDMGGSAACVGALLNLVHSKVKQNIHAVLCIAENSVDAHSFRNDDIITMYSGKTVEINNTDAEGRLVLADGVAYSCKHLNPQIVIDIATLTGAQLTATGKTHAGLVTNSTDLESLFIESGKATGELLFPMIYCPELLLPEFDSKVADMKNSVKDRANASSSCAAHFVESHLTKQVDWVHLDIAGPSFKSDRGTGFGSGLLADAVKRLNK